MKTPYLDALLEWVEVVPRVNTQPGDSHQAGRVDGWNEALRKFTREILHQHAEVTRDNNGETAWHTFTEAMKETAE